MPCSIYVGQLIEFIMIILKLKRTALRLDFSFVAVLAVFFLLDDSGTGLAALTICAAHELSHLAVMRICGIVPESVTFYGAGIRITAPDTENRTAAVQAAVYSAGCVMNFLLAGILFALHIENAAAISLFTGCFNLLPIGEFDGRRLLKLAVVSGASPERVDRILFLCGLAAALLTGIVAALSGGASPTLVITAVYIIIMSLRGV